MSVYSLSLFYLTVVLLIVLKFLISKSHILMILLTLEVMMLCNLSVITVVSWGGFTFAVVLLFFCFSVCEACAGIGMLVLNVRLFGSDMVNTYF